MTQQEINKRLVGMSKEEQIKFLEDWEFDLSMDDFIQDWDLYNLLGKMIQELKESK